MLATTAAVAASAKAPDGASRDAGQRSNSCFLTDRNCRQGA
ncbi:hypothetical protein [Halomonas alkalisoli]|nr:hypothetical protein [Halomonas alkalisoli]